MDPGERDAILGTGGPTPQERERGSSWFWTVREERHSSITTGAGDGLATTSGDGYAQSECYCVQQLCSISVMKVVSHCIIVSGK